MKRKTSSEDDTHDIALLAHLIPLAQNTDTLTTTKTCCTHNNNTFTCLLLSRPENRAMRATLQGAQENLSCEQVFSLMRYLYTKISLRRRNIFCHETDFNWRHVREMATQAFEYFGSREKLWEMLLSCYTAQTSKYPLREHRLPARLFNVVVGHTDCSQDCSPSNNKLNQSPNASEPHQHPWVNNIPVPLDFFICLLKLIPSRANNSIVDLNFEDQMNHFMQESDIGHQLELFTMVCSFSSE